MYLLIIDISISIGILININPVCLSSRRPVGCFIGSPDLQAHSEPAGLPRQSGVPGLPRHSGLPGLPSRHCHWIDEDDDEVCGNWLWL